MAKLTNEIIDERICKHNITRLEDYINDTTKILWKCEAGHLYFTTYDRVRNGIRKGYNGCKECRFINDKIIDKRLVGYNVKRLGNFTKSNIKIKFMCLVKDCNFVWEAFMDNVFASIKNGSNGCPKCANNIRFTNEIIDDFLKDKSIKRLGNYINNRTSIEFLCKDCDNIWNGRLDNLNISFNHDNNGCPECNRNFLAGKNEKIIKKIFDEFNINHIWHANLKKIFDYDKTLFVDFYLPDHNLIIEYNGKQHYEPVCFGGISKSKAERIFNEYQLPRDNYVKNFCLNKNINLIEIDGRNYTFNKLERYFKTEILPKIKRI